MIRLFQTLPLLCALLLAPAVAQAQTVPTAAILYTTPAGGALAAELADCSPQIAASVIQITLPANPTAAQLYAAVDAKIDRLQYTYIQLMPDVPLAVNWPGVPGPGVGCGVSAGTLWPTASLLMGGWTTTDSPPDLAYQGLIYESGPYWQKALQPVAHLIGTEAQVRAKIALATATPVAKAGVVIDGPGKAGPANNSGANCYGIETYWEYAWSQTGLSGLKTRSSATYPYPILNDMTGYRVERDCTDTLDDMPAAAWSLQTRLPFPTVILWTPGKHLHADGKWGPKFPGTQAYTGFAPRAVAFNTDSYSARSLADGLQGYLDSGAAAYIGNVNEPCNLGLQHKTFVTQYLDKQKPLAVAFAYSLDRARHPLTCFGVAWMTAK